MPKTQSRLRKHDMKEDSFVTFAFRAQEFIQTHQRNLLAGLGIVVAVVAVSWYWTSSSQQSAVEGESVLSEAFVRVQQGDMVGAASVYQRVIDDFGSTAAGREATYYLANLYFVQEQWDDAIRTYHKYLDQYAGFDRGRRAAAWAAIGDAYQAMENHTEALSSYDQALAIPDTDYIQGDIMLSAARSALALNDTARATALADRLFELQGNSASMINMRELLAAHDVYYQRGF